MADDSRYADLAARLLRERPPAPPSRITRDEGVSAVAEALAQRKRRRTTRAALGAAGVSLAAGVALFLFWPANGVRHTAAAACTGGPCASAGSRALARSDVPAPRSLSSGEGLVAPLGAPTSLTLASGTRITLDERSAIECREDTRTQRFAVLRGRARWQVAKLGAGERFLVETPNAEIEVRGTVFSVRVDEPAPGCPSRTTVEVDEGAVAVRFASGQVVLQPGERWASACLEASPLGSSAPATAAHTAPSGKAVSGATHATAITALPAVPGAEASAAPSPAGVPVSMLTEQNDLYARAQVAKREGRRDEALAAYGRLLELFPGGPLAETALVQRERLLREP